MIKINSIIISIILLISISIIGIVNSEQFDTDSCFNDCMKRYRCYVEFNEAECISVADRCDRLCSK